LIGVFVATLLSINNYFYRRGGAEVVFFEQNRLFEEKGWQVVPFAMQHLKNLPSAWSEYFINDIEFGSEYSIWEKAVRFSKVVYSFEACAKLHQLIERVQPQIAHAHNVYHHISPAIFGVLRHAGIPTVLTLHDLKIACPAYKMLTHDGVCERCKGGALYNVVLHRCIKDSLAVSTLVLLESMVHRLLGCYQKNVDRFIVPSRFYIEKFIEWGWPRERFLYIPNFVDVHAHEPNYTPGRYFLYFGRLGPEKGLQTLVKAAGAANLPLALAGTGPEQEALRCLATTLGVDVRFLGHLEGKRLHETIRGAKAIVLPSEWYENAPMSIMEAYALGKPVIGAAIGGIPELIRNDETGYLFESRNVQDLADCLSRFNGLSNVAISRMGNAGRTWIEQDFTTIRYVERLRTLYGELGVLK
jgi:glycosyltransferase involved in cell wall biosynthesis